MLERLLEYEREFFLILNNYETPFLNDFLWLYSGFVIWIPILLFFIWVLIYKIDRKQWLPVFVSLILLIIVSNILVGLVAKPYFARFRPTHHPLFIDDIKTLYGYEGGLYGFISGHSTAAMSIAMFLSLLFRNKIFSVAIFLWALIMIYSRIYLGAHFISDVIAGSFTGLILGILFYQFYLWYAGRMSANESTDTDHVAVYSRKRVHLITVVLIAYILLFALLGKYIVPLLVDLL